MWWGHHTLGWGGLLIGALMMLLFWGGLFVLGWLLIRATMASRSQQATGQDHSSGGPLQILKARYARGEIDKAEYEEIRRDLET